MIEIDGSYGEGGGQILRSSLSLSAITGHPVRIHRIRAGRKKPGLRPQHVLSAEATARICEGTIEGLEVGSTELRFYPGRIHSGQYSLDVSERMGSAGSSSLILQTIFWPLGFSGGRSRVLLKGGTHVPWSPPANYVREVFLPTLIPMGVSAALKVPRWGFYPIGGGELEISLDPFRTPLSPLRLPSRGRLKKITISSVVANLPMGIANRQLDRALARLREKGFEATGHSQSASAPGKGTFCFILTEFERIRAGFSALGAIGKPAEQVADEATEACLDYLGRDAVLDPHLADQVLIGMALATGVSSASISRVTEHLKTNIWLIGQFLGARFLLRENRGIGTANLEVKGTGFQPTLTSPFDK